MGGAPVPMNEDQRLLALRRYKILDTMQEQVYDDIVMLASHICGTPVALVSLVDQSRQWFKAKRGIDVDQTDRDIAFCAHAILGNEIFEVPDARQDPRFMNNPLVVGPQQVQFYAGAPLTTLEGYNVGTLCVIDSSARTLTAEQQACLKALARQVMILFESRLAYEELESHKAATVHASRIQALGEMASGIAHEINNPLGIIFAQASILRDRAVQKPELQLGECTKELERITRTVSRISKIVSGLRTFARNGDHDPFVSAKVGDIIDDVMTFCNDRLNRKGITCKVIYSHQLEPSIQLVCRPVQIGQVLMNLVSNSIDALLEMKPATGLESPDRWIEIHIRRADSPESRLEISVRDAGLGISAEVESRLMQPFFTTKQVGKGTGLGLSISLGLAKAHKGTLFYRLEDGHTAFVLQLPLDQNSSSNSGSKMGPAA